MEQLLMKHVATIASNVVGHGKVHKIVDSRVAEFSVGFKAVLSYTFKSLTRCKPSWRANFKSQEEVQGYKEALGLAMMESGIDTVEKLEHGLIQLRKDTNDFMPCVGKFIDWCKDGIRREEERQRIIERADARKVQQIESGTFEERQAIAKPNIDCLRLILKESRRGNK
jgi:hypothetical protein